MAENVFLENKRKLSLTEYMNYNTNDRGNLGSAPGGRIQAYGIFHTRTAGGAAGGRGAGAYFPKGRF